MCCSSSPDLSVEHLADRFFGHENGSNAIALLNSSANLVNRPSTICVRFSHGTTPPGCLDCRAVEPACRQFSVGFAALAHGRVQPFLSGRVVRQIAYGAAPDRGRTLLELLELLDRCILPEAIDEIGMSQDRSASSSVIALAAAGEAHNRPPFVQLKAISHWGGCARSRLYPFCAP